MECLVPRPFPSGNYWFRNEFDLKRRQGGGLRPRAQRQSHGKSPEGLAFLRKRLRQRHVVNTKQNRRAFGGKLAHRRQQGRRKAPVIKRDTRSRHRACGGNRPIAGGSVVYGIVE